jgi:hypothetical protein
MVDVISVGEEPGDDGCGWSGCGRVAFGARRVRVVSAAGSNAVVVGQMIALMRRWASRRSPAVGQPSMILTMVRPAR